MKRIIKHHRRNHAKACLRHRLSLLHSRGGVIQTDLSESGNQKPNLQSWADNIRKMIEIDKRTENQVRGMIEWSQHNVFWASNILSAKNCEKNTTQWQRKQIVIIKQNKLKRLNTRNLAQMSCLFERRRRHGNCWGNHGKADTESACPTWRMS